MLKVYGTRLCPDCVEAERILKENHIEYEYIEITETTGKLKEFLKIRDNLDLFEAVKKEGNIGIPCFAESENITLELANILKYRKTANTIK